MLRLPPMRIALVSTPFVPVPPPAYGGTELVVAELADGLREAGHEVRVYTCGAALPPSGERGDAPGLERRVLFERPVWPPGPWLELAHSAWAALDLARADPPFDLVHTLFPVCWKEPFGPVMIEAMLSGTPELALPRGAVPEVVDDGITGYVCADEDELAQRLNRLERGGLDRARCRQHAVLRFSRRRLVREHLALYRGLVGAGAGLALLAPQP